MALTGRRLCRLDAICAKLKQINHESPPDAKNATNERTPAKEDRYTEVIGEDLSMKCLNNNIIGTVDLHLPTSAEAEDLSVHKDDKKTTVKPDVSTHNQVEETYNKTAESNSSHSQHEQAKPNIDNAHKTINTPSGSSRRKSRKAAAPRNINQVREFYDQYDVDDKDELAEYEANNQNTNFPPDNCDAEEKETDQSGHDSFCGSDSRNGQYSPGGHDSLGCSKDYEETLSNSSHSSHNKAQKDISGHNSETVDLSNRSLDLKHSLRYSSFRDQSHGALDLSVQKDPDHPEDDSPMNGYMSSDDDDFFHPDKNFDKDKQDIKSDSLSSSVSSNESRRESGEQAAHLKDYAESTMNELISMYGFGVAGLSNIAKNVPLTNFSSLAQLPSVSAKLAACMALPSGVQNKLLMNGLAPRVESTEADQKRKGIYANFVQKVQATSTPVKAAEGAPVKPVSDRFTNSAAYINAVFNSQNAQHQESASGATPAGGKHLIPDYSKYLKRYNNGTECGGQHCFDLGYKEHYHCIDCSFHVFIKKEEMVRHYKWHRKREESLQHGFLRFSPLDNCTKRFGMCTHNGRQTHYHCLQNGCDKVYISTSDVQMHANYHRKDSAIMSEGFQRFRATEDCGTQACSFYGHRTTHFHCLRPGCRFTFKNKADMEKHKSYHQKDEVLGRDGFKKFMKYEQCAYSSCRYSKVSNHIHCIRPGCDYVLHSTAQLYSHKRKHERRDFEHAYKQYQDGHHPPTVTSQPSPNLPSLNGNSAIPHMAMLSAGMKRSAEWPDLPEMKRMKVEPTSDMDESSPSSPSGISEGRSTPIDRYTPQSDPPECEENMDTSNNGDVSTDVKTEMFSLSEDKLNNSLNLPIPGQLNSIKEETPSPATENQSTVSGNLYSMSGNQSTVFGNQPALPGNQSANNNNTGIRPISFPSGPMKVGSLPMMNPTLITVPSQALAAATALQPPKSVYTERREKDDSWKVYLVRYTANDPCNPRCLYLYKDHYHCKMEGCLVLFKSKDGVREHARFHELQERITPIAYQTYEQTSNCPDACQYSDKEKHYHCIWTGCTHVVPHIGPTFGRLEHYRVHEMARTAAGKSYSRASSKSTSMSVMDDSSMRRRGRPPKYPKIEMPHIPRVVLSDEEIRQSSQVNVASDGELTSQTKVIKGFRMFTRDDPCPDQECPYITKHHFHCARPRCFTVTDRMDILNLHAKDFHSFVTIMEGFEYFDRTASCRRIHCQHNMTNRHFHCTRKRCDYSFIRHSTMAQHDKKHNSMPVQPLHLTKSDMSVSPSQFIPIVPAISSNSVKSPTIAPIVQPAGTFIPTSILQQFQNISIPLATMMAHQANQIAAISQDQLVMPPVSMAGIPISNVTMGNMAMEISPVQALPATIPATQLMSASTIPNAVSSTETLTSPLITAAGASLAASAINSTNGQGAGPTVPLTVLLQRGANQIPQPSWAEIRSMMHFALTQNCGRPFCKLKKKDHYHCSECNQAFSDPARLRSHIGKHGLRFKRPEHGGNMFRQVDIAPRPSVMIADPACDDMDPDEAQCLAEAGKMVDDDDSDDNDGLKGSSSLTLNPSTFSQMISKAQEENRIASDIGDSDDGMSVSHSSSKSISNDVSGMNLIIDETAGNEAKTDDLNQSGRKIAKTEPEDFMNSNDTNLNNSHQMSSPGSFPVNSPKHISVSKVGSSSNGTVKDAIVSPRTKDDSIPSGYTRWKYNEECCYAKCAYRHSVTHFHCVRADCGYGFSDRSRLVQHTLRHERIDSITGGEMQQFRINQDCKTGGCEYNTRMSHFHCNRCTYNCTDSSKVLTHRKHHAKQDSINSQGFQKYQSIEDCSIPLCPYSRKQNHYHCLIASCKAAVLGPAQMTSHKLKHDTE